MDVELVLEEEIGNPHFFVGRKQELDFFLAWADRTKQKMSKSIAVLARRRKGKTALLQRLFNIIYTRNDPQIIPFYFRVPEGKSTLLKFSDLFYRRLLSSYFGFKTRNPKFINNSLEMPELKELAVGDDIILKDIQSMEYQMGKENQEACWYHARYAGERISILKDERIIQILDEFQYLDKFTYYSVDSTEPMRLTGFYQHIGSSKISPQIIAGSYIGWLSRIIDKMVDRYRSYYLESLNEEDALAAVYNYARIYKQPVTDESAVWLAEACDRDPYAISLMFESEAHPKDLTSIEGVRKVLDYETDIPKGQMAKLWFEYLATVIERTNDVNAKRIVLYLAKYGTEERNREQITQDLGLELTDRELDNLMQKLVAADILAQGKTRWAFHGLGDPVFEMVFRKAYEPEIARVDLSVVRKNLAAELDQRTKDLASEKGRVARYKGLVAEYRLRHHLTMAGQKRRRLGDLARHADEPDRRLAPFATVQKHSFHPDDEQIIEVDLYAQSPEGPDLVIEVKDWAGKVNKDQVLAFIDTKKQLQAGLSGNTLYLFYSEQPIAEVNIERLKEADILYADHTTFNW
ncbi:MAG: hypothetical protein QNK37_14310 [Acidobacteriota bacterium]|nr:hypothetical protein [Acidobacteriota bacterium]